MAKRVLRRLISMAQAVTDPNIPPQACMPTCTLRACPTAVAVAHEFVLAYILVVCANIIGPIVLDLLDNTSLTCKRSIKVCNCPKAYDVV